MLLTVVRRAVPGSTRPRRRAAVAAAGVQQQSSAGSTGTGGGALQQLVAASTCSATPAAAAAATPPPPSSASPSQSFAALPSPRWEGATSQRGGARSAGSRSSPRGAGFVRHPSSAVSSSSVRSRNIATRTGVAQQQQQQQQGGAAGASPGAGVERGSGMGVTARHCSHGGGGGGGGGAGAVASRRWLWTAAAVTAVTAVTATTNTNTASTTPCSLETASCPGAAVATRAPTPSAALRARRGRTGGGTGVVDEGGRAGCDCEQATSRSIADDSPSGSLTTAFGATLVPARSNVEETEGQGEELTSSSPAAFVEADAGAARAAAAAAAEAAAAATQDRRASAQQRSGGRRRPGGGRPSWWDTGGFLRAAPALNLRGGARAVSSAAGGRGGGGGGGKGGKEEAEGAGEGKGGEAGGRGKNIPLAGRPLFTSVASTKGHRQHMEDEFFLSSCGSFSAVYDGHGGANVSEYLRRNLYKHVMDHLPPGDDVYGLKTVERALRLAFKSADDYVVTQTPYGNEGSCAVSVTIHCDRDGKVSIISCNLGDSRAVLSRAGQALDLTEDHKPNSPREMERIYRHDGMVTWEGFECSQGLQIEGTGVYRINGNLAVARAIGDIDYRPWVSAEVDIKTIDMKRGKDQFVILASDGLWDVMSSEEAVQYVHAVMGGAMGSGSGKEGDKWKRGGKAGAGEGAGAEKPPHTTLVNWTQSYAEDRGMIRAATMLRKKKMASYLTEEALRRGSMDNTTVAIVWLQ